MKRVTLRLTEEEYQTLNEIRDQLGESTINKAVKRMIQHYSEILPLLRKILSTRRKVYVIDEETAREVERVSMELRQYGGWYGGYEE